MRRRKPRVSAFRRRGDRDGRDRRRLLPRVRRAACRSRVRRSCSRRCSRAQTQLHIPSPVRIAGVDVGQVVSVTRVPNSSNAAVVTMDIDPNGLPIHADATAKIRPRIFLEGNFYVDLHPGSPSAPALTSGATLPAAEHRRAGAARPRAVGTHLRPARRTCRRCCRGSARRSTARSTAAQDATQDPSVRGLTGGQALNLSLKYSPRRVQGVVDRQPGAARDPAARPSKVVLGNEHVFRALAASDGSLSSFDHDVQRDDGDAGLATAAAQPDDRAAAAVAAGDPTRRTPRSTRRSRRRRSSRARSCRASSSSARRSTPGSRGSQQATALMSPQELGGLLNDLTPAVQNTAASLGVDRGAAALR